ncbi:hypothetical protein PRUPE_2G015500 [Prunus persica]|uniref:Uncharacterized protein n=1 Tax=Prunus persica TaxID=3760 RepID=A0A251Q9E1_PRUPE|nr:hypothetical protein PRUPE_2G015500 [Prunus persica]
MVCPIDSEIGEAFAPFSISSQRGQKIIHQSPFQGNKNNKGLGPPRASRDSGSSSILVSFHTHSFLSFFISCVVS